MDFSVPADHRVKLKENEKRDKYLDLARELKKTVKHEGDTNCNWCTWNDLQGLSKRAGRVRNRRMSGDYPNYSIVEVGQNTEETNYRSDSS